MVGRPRPRAGQPRASEGRLPRRAAQLEPRRVRQQRARPGLPVRPAGFAAVVMTIRFAAVLLASLAAQPPPSPSPLPLASPEAGAPEYRVGVGDVLQLEVF